MMIRNKCPTFAGICLLIALITRIAYSDSNWQDIPPCPDDAVLIAKFKVDTTTTPKTYKFVEPSGNEGIVTIENYQQQYGTWTSGSSHPIQYVMIKGGTNIHTYTYTPPATSGTFHYKDVGRIGIGRIQFCGPEATAVTLLSFTARSNGKGDVILDWETATEIDTAGFNLYRARLKNGYYYKINESLIPARGNSTTGAHYRYVDTPQVDGRYHYFLEDVDSQGKGTKHGPKKVRIRK